MDTKKQLSSKQRIQTLLEHTTGVVKLDDVQKAFGVSRGEASFILWRLVHQGWLRRLKGNLYRVVPLESADASITDENPWMIASELYVPCYIGGWTAVNFWGLTDQLFLKTWVMTTNTVHKKNKSVAQHEFILKQIKQDLFFGTKTEWIEQNKILISDPHKTVLDSLNFPEEYTAQSVVEIFQSYLHSEHKNMQVLTEYVHKLSNRSALKRLGFLLELLAPNETVLIEFCHQNISKGYSPLSTKSPCTKSIGKWNLRVPEGLLERQRHD